MVRFKVYEIMSIVAHNSVTDSEAVLLVPWNLLSKGPSSLPSALARGIGSRRSEIDQSDDAAEASEIEVRSTDHSARSKGKNFLPSFLVIRTGSRGTFIL